MRARPCYAELRRRCKEEGTFAPCRHGSRRSASSRSSIRVRQRSSAAAAESCGAKAAAAVSDRAACSMNRRRRGGLQHGVRKVQQMAAATCCGERRSVQPLRQRGGGQKPKAEPKAQCVCPVLPLRAMHGHERAQRDPGHAHRVGHDDAMHRLAEQQAAGADRAENGGRIAARIDQGDVRRVGRRGPRAAFEALEVRHEADRSTAGARRGKQHGGIAQAADLRQAEPPGRQRATDPVDDPVRVQRRRRLVTAVAGAGDQLHRPRLVARVEHGADAEKLFGRIIVKEARQQLRPQQRIQLVAEISRRTAPAVKLHTRYSPGTRLRPSADRTKPAA